MRIAKHPLGPGHVILSRDLLPCYIANMCGMAGEMAVMFFVPLYFQAVEGLSATATGSMLVPSTIAGMSGSLAGGWVIKRTGKFYWPTVASFGVLFLSMMPLVGSVWCRSLFGVNSAFVVSAAGNGGGITTILIALLANAPTEDSAVAIACSYLFRSLGSSVGVGISSAVLQQVLREQLSHRIGNDDDAGQIEEKVRQSLDAIKELPPLVAEQVRSSYRVAIMGSLAPPLCFGLVCFLATFWVKEKPLNRR
ncbi:hypothetical protein MKX07_005592 [Trichoderma sp. CBMAI-0711]|nr:hypothetical protein MKX07_005592 [Trichoderma sp. CBMAI-0711]